MGLVSCGHFCSCLFILPRPGGAQDTVYEMYVVSQQCGRFVGAALWNVLAFVFRWNCEDRLHEIVGEHAPPSV